MSDHKSMDLPKCILDPPVIKAKKFRTQLLLSLFFSPAPVLTQLSFQSCRILVSNSQPPGHEPDTLPTDQPGRGHRAKKAWFKVLDFL